MNKFKQSYYNNKTFRLIVQLLLVAVGAAISGMVFRTFYSPNNITPTGFSGLAKLISEWLSWAGVSISYSVIYLIMNVILLACAYKFMGWRFLLFTAVGIGSYTLCMEYGDITIISSIAQNDPLLYTIIGAMLNNIGIGLVFRAGGSTGGSDIAVLLLNKFFPRVKTGQWSLVIGGIIICLCALTYGIEMAFYALIAAIVGSRILDMMLDGTKTVRAFYIICDNDVRIAERILETFHRGVTKLNAQGAFSLKEKKILLCLVTTQQAPYMNAIVREEDKNAFVFSTTVKEMLGEGDFMREASIFKNAVKYSVTTLKSEKLCHLAERKKWKNAKAGKTFTASF